MNLEKAKKEYIKQYRQDNREIILEQMKQYYQDNKEQINKKTKCPCGSIVNKQCLARHYRTLIHQDWLCKQATKPTKIKLTIKLKQT